MKKETVIIGGGPAGLIAAEYIANELKQLGLEPISENGGILTHLAVNFC